jgi:hypothetical protein
MRGFPSQLDLSALTLVFPIAIAFATCALPGAGASHAQSYLPLAPGNRWVYQGVNGLHEIQAITGTMTIQGRTVFVKSYLKSSSNLGLENYWSEDLDGDLLLSGFFRNGIDPWGLVYDPPVLLLDAPLALGKTWTTRFTAYQLPAMELLGTYELTLEVFEDTTLVVPAGTFRAFGIGQPPTPAIAAFASHGSLSLDGALWGSGGSPSDWYAAGVGVVQYDADDRYQLAVSDNVGVEPVAGIDPRAVSLAQNYPNPSHGLTHIEYTMPTAENVVLELYDVQGREIRTLVDAHQPSGRYRVDLSTQTLPSGVYFYRLRAGSLDVRRKMLIMQ